MAVNKPDAPQNGNENTLSICNPSGLHGKVGTSETVEAINEIYSDGYDEFVSYARSRVGSMEAGQDVVQQAFTNTLNAVENGAHISNIGGFVRRCVHNLCVNRGYREPREQALSLEESLHEMTGKSTVASAEIRQQWREVESVVDQLAPNQRDAFLLTEIRGYTYRETAESMNLSISSVRQLLNRARSKIRARADTGADSIIIPAPVLGADSALNSWQAQLRSNISDLVQRRVSELQAWLGNVSQTCTDAVLQSTATVVTGLAIVVLGTVPAFAPSEQDIDRTTPVASGVAKSPPQVSRPNSESTTVQIKEAAPTPPVAASPSPDVTERLAAVPPGHGSTDNSTVSSIAEFDDNDKTMESVIVTDPEPEPEPEPVEEPTTDPEGSSDDSRPSWCPPGASLRQCTPLVDPYDENRFVDVPECPDIPGIPVSTAVSTGDCSQGPNQQLDGRPGPVSSGAPQKAM